MNHEALQKRVNANLKKSNLVTGLGERERVRSGLSSGSMRLNAALSGSPLIGYAWGRMVEIYGPESSGKTTLALHAVLETQKLERRSGEPVPALFVDAEQTLDISYAGDMGIDLDNLSLSQPACGEEALDTVEAAIRAGFKLVVVDSVAALTPMAEIEGEMGDSHMGLHARLMSQGCRKLNKVCSDHGAIIIWTNQIRMKLGVVFGNPETTPGGKALKYWTTYRLEIRSPRSGKKVSKVKSLADEDKEETVETGTKVEVKVAKNKMYPPHRTAQFEVVYGIGIDKHRDALDYLVSAGAFRKVKGKKQRYLRLPSRGKSYTYTAVLGYFRKDLDVVADILELIQEIDERLE